MRRPIVTLTTDFGVKDHFVGVMKGVIASISPDATVVDISHEVRPYEITEGAFLVAQACRYFPPKTVHVAVVDPGVGSARRPIMIEAEKQFFVGPDNGVLAMVYATVSHRARELTSDKYFVHPVSHTFHGRDIFAPVAAHLSKGVRPSLLGPIIDNHLKPVFTEPQRTSKRTWQGTVLHVDRFGNLITNFHVDQFPKVATAPFDLAIGTLRLMRLAQAYADVDPGEPFVIVGSSGYLEVAANQGSAARLLGCATGAPCELTVS
ncbi:MAG TPA: SAM-dependent chlorinase/fluorinase [Bryobacteraceae bacterium]|nr:SAM-dependent chlorinase/fluorinase [Bryobacteraceae bacterium]